MLIGVDYKERLAWTADPDRNAFGINDGMTCGSSALPKTRTRKSRDETSASWTSMWAKSSLRLPPNFL